MIDSYFFVEKPMLLLQLSYTFPIVSSHCGATVEPLWSHCSFGMCSVCVRYVFGMCSV